MKVIQNIFAVFVLLILLIFLTFAFFLMFSRPETLVLPNLPVTTQLEQSSQTTSPEILSTEDEE